MHVYCCVFCSASSKWADKVPGRDREVEGERGGRTEEFGFALERDRGVVYAVDHEQQE